MSARPAVRNSLTEIPAGGLSAPSAVRARRWRHLRLLALVAAWVLVVAACDPSPYRGSPSGPKLAIVGDSLVCDIEGQANDRFVYQGWYVSITALGGYTVQDHEDTFRKVAATNPQVVVVALGANDIREIDAGLQTYDEYRRDVRVTLELFRDVPFIVWVGVNTTSGFWGPDGDHRVVGPWINIITVVELAASGRDPGTTLYADWATESEGRLDYFVIPGEVHHSALGSAAYLDLIDRSIASFPGEPDPAVPGLGERRPRLGADRRMGGRPGQHDDRHPPLRRRPLGRRVHGRPVSPRRSAHVPGVRGLSRLRRDLSGVARCAHGLRVRHQSGS